MERRRQFGNLEERTSVVQPSGRSLPPRRRSFVRPTASHGNVRELRYGIEQAVILSEGEILCSREFRLADARWASREEALLEQGHSHLPNQVK